MSSRSTYAKAEMKFIDTTALDDAVESTDYNQSFADLSLLKDQVSSDDYINLGLNYTVLDGSKSEMPDNVSDIAFFSNVKSKSNCLFDDVPMITVDFTENHTSCGITLFFANEAPKKVQLIWYDLNNVPLENKTVIINSLTYFVNAQVTNYGKLEIYFLETYLPNRYIQLNYILYGIILDWQDQLIQSATLTEEVDETNNTLPMNKCTLAIIDENNDFDIANSNGAWNAVQRNQKIILDEIIDGVIIPLGDFYLKDWSFSKNIAKFNLIDIVGYIEQFTFYGGIYTNYPVSDLIDDILEPCGIDYQISADLSDITVSGYLGIITCRAALQQVCFCTGIMADCSRSDHINIFIPESYVKTSIDTDRKFNGNSKVTLDNYVSSIKITSSKYTKASEVSEIYNGELAAGQTKIEYTQPFDTDISVDNTAVCTILEAHNNYCIVSMRRAATVVISGYAYNKSDFSTLKEVEELEANELENAKEFKCDLYSTVIGDVLQKLLDFYSYRQLVEVKYLIDSEMVTDWVSVRDKSRNMTAALIYQQSIDLSGGFIAKAKLRGYNVVPDYHYYAGTELYGNDDFLI